MKPGPASIGRKLRDDEITREREQERILASFKLFDVPDNERAEILEALGEEAKRDA